jgi:hypothetical protein
LTAASSQSINAPGPEPRPCGSPVRSPARF